MVDEDSSEVGLETDQYFVGPGFKSRLCYDKFSHLNPNPKLNSAVIYLNIYNKFQHYISIDIKAAGTHCCIPIITHTFTNTTATNLMNLHSTTFSSK